MKITILNSTLPSHTNRYIANRVIEAFPETRIVTINASSFSSKLNYYKSLYRKIKRNFNKKNYSWIISKLKDRKKLVACERDWNDVYLDTFKKNSSYLDKPIIPSVIVNDTNSSETQKILEADEPDFIIQNGAPDLLKENIFSIPKYFTVNLHHGVAPKIRGGNSIFWGLYHGKKEWVGVTLHKIDKGIDTGDVIKRKKMPFNYGEHPASIFAKATLIGTEFLIDFLQASKNCNPNSLLNKANEKGVYKSFFNSSQYEMLKKNNWHPVQES